MDIRVLGRVDYAATYDAMRTFTDGRDDGTPDQLWLCEHAPVYTLGQAGKPEHVLNPRQIEVVQTDRGGQVTYHGPGQVVAYPLVDLRRLGIFVKEYVFRLETALIQTLNSWDITGHRVAGAPGIYVSLAAPSSHGQLTGPRPDPFAGLGKIAALGIKITRHRTYHGVALNVAMDLSPFDGINPCGYAGLRSVDLATLGVSTDWGTAAARLGERLATHLSP
ncbi:lipoyl(octanoyl) transferase LipB [Aquabacterium sp. A7-Y]|uniref:lipoyl(octanoyl) transferase LipB n=1 Tax=Aquabacterium sp. A7-Y TaxID=1349605 RepID=UPI00223E748E|nr:lipoyl(octanoyl) transferase LipB [Aquabacterium sp. A7-Y]MCW7539107.1 lipoyl(octanoyl) transferase LipB [Aquabacterium sp. A7-Y]